ncbi:hypothetical protein L596_011402 [Steinernema carpocapsae]|uniref:Gamma-tubulin complex component n=1 Tax=Steinernema carpocapsae TaxID=34508 RepID=A0A4U5NUQ2_STECR|nr:hypothetical protein L596_011402 [Steinernema carpocapsae]
MELNSPDFNVSGAMVPAKSKDWQNSRVKLLRVDNQRLPQRSSDYLGDICNDENLYGASSMLDFSQLTNDDQEELIYDELIMILSGHDTVNIRRQFSEEGFISWCVNEKLNQTLRNQVLECLSLASQLHTAKKHIHRILSDGRKGRVAQSVAVICNDIVHQALEDLCFDLGESPAKHVSAVVSKAKRVELTAVDIAKILRFICENNLVGGAVIGYLYEQKSYFLPSGFSEVLNKMISAAEEAYYVILYDWITTGSLAKDRAYEFMVWDLLRAKTLTLGDFTNDGGERMKEYDSFEKRFVLIGDLCPKTLESVQENVVKAGKYLYLYEQHAAKAKPEPLPFDYVAFREATKRDLAMVQKVIKDTCEKSSANLLNLLRQKYDLELFSKSFGRFFLDDGSGWLSNFVDIIVTKAIDYETVNIRDLNTSFNAAIDSSLLKNNTFRPSFKLVRKQFRGVFQCIHSRTRFVENEPTTQVRESIAFDVSLNPAFAIIFPGTVIQQYNNFFHILFHLKRTQVLLLRKRVEQTRGAFKERALLNTMLRFVNKALQYVSEWVLSGQLKIFHEAIRSANSVEEVIAVQERCLTEATKKCSLDPDCVEFVDIILNVILSYASGDWSDYEEVGQTLATNLDSCMEVVSQREKSLTSLTPLTYWLFRSSGSYILN